MYTVNFFYQHSDEDSDIFPHKGYWAVIFREHPFYAKHPDEYPAPILLWSFCHNDEIEVVQKTALQLQEMNHNMKLLLESVRIKYDSLLEGK